MATEQSRAGEFLLTIGNGSISNDEIIIGSGAGVLEAGQVLGKVTATGKYRKYDSTATNGTETAVAVLYSRVDATTDTKALAVTRLAEVKRDAITDVTADVIAQLAQQFIIVR